MPLGNLHEALTRRSYRPLGNAGRPLSTVCVAVCHPEFFERQRAIPSRPGLLQHDPNLCVLLVGGGPQESNLKRQAEALGITRHVVFAGRVPHAEVNQYYSIIDMLVYARHSIRLTELVTPLKPLEAMAQGQLFIASDIGGHRALP